MLRDLLRGARMLGEGFGIMARNPRLWLLGMVPAVLATIVIVGAVVAAGIWAGELVAWLTPFADDWSGAARQAIRVSATIALMVGVVAVGVVAFTALTLLIGGPFYEYLAERVEDQLGGAPPDQHPSWLRTFVRGLRDSALLVTVSVACTLPLFCLGFVPVLGQTVVPALVACVGGWILALELVGVPFQRRGLRLADRHRALRSRPAVALGFGIPVYLLCAVPLLAIVVIPVASAAGVLVAREVLPRQAAEEAR